MIQAKCIQKFRNNNGKIYGYRLIDINGQTQDVIPDELKIAIKNGQLDVVNLTLTKDNRLVDKDPDKILENKKIMPGTPVIHTQKIGADQAYKNILNIAKLIYTGLGLGEAVELTSFDNSYGNMLDKRFEPQLNYKYQEDLNLAITYYLDSGDLWLALENLYEGESILELKGTMQKEDIKRIVKEFVYKVKNNI